MSLKLTRAITENIKKNNCPLRYSRVKKKELRIYLHSSEKQRELSLFPRVTGVKSITKISIRKRKQKNNTLISGNNIRY